MSSGNGGGMERGIRIGGGSWIDGGSGRSKGGAFSGCSPFGSVGGAKGGTIGACVGATKS
jgi:hypothetical protein